MNKALILVLIAEFWITIGQVCLKKGADRLNLEGNAQAPWIIRSLGCLLRFPVLWLGTAGMVVGMLFWFAALSNGELSYVYLLGSIQYIFALLAAHFFLNEKIDTNKLIGTLFITLGIILTVAG